MTEDKRKKCKIEWHVAGSSVVHTLPVNAKVIFTDGRGKSNTCVWIDSEGMVIVGDVRDNV